MNDYPNGFDPFTDDEMREIFLDRDLEEWAKLNPQHRNASGEDWDRWLAAHDAEVRAQALKDAIQEVRFIPCWAPRGDPNGGEFDIDGYSHRRFVIDRLLELTEGGPS